MKIEAWKLANLAYRQDAPKTDPEVIEQAQKAKVTNLEYIHASLAVRLGLQSGFGDWESQKTFGTVHTEVLGKVE
ncbi:hypothetical protein MYX82_12330 [Acidobacteria bacterium AH-259-D05]|nr:hypothetical protein [Acidobacteria bacterium AH-259-D05]